VAAGCICRLLISSERIVCQYAFVYERLRRGHMRLSAVYVRFVRVCGSSWWCV